MELTPEYFMKQALRQAEQAFAEDEVPIGAVVVANNQIIGKGYNQVEKLNTTLLHMQRCWQLPHQAHTYLLSI